MGEASFGKAPGVARQALELAQRHPFTRCMATWKLSCLLSPFHLLLLCISATPLHAAQFKFANQTLTVPDGFEVELIAQSPLVDRPVSGSFDEQGRLYLTDSSGANEKPDKQLEARPHRVVRLEDKDDDGKFDKT